MHDTLTALQALSDSTRFEVFNCIRGCGGSTVYDDNGYCDAGLPDSVALCDVRCQVPCSPSTLSHHLNVLREAKLIETERRGRNTYITVNKLTLIQISNFLMDIK